MADENQKMEENLNMMKADIQATLEAGLDKLADAKLSRDAMAQMLLDVAMKIQGTDVGAVLAEGTKTEE